MLTKESLTYSYLKHILPVVEMEKDLQQDASTLEVYVKFIYFNINQRKRVSKKKVYQKLYC